jgi:hypothetical protein
MALDAVETVVEEFALVTVEAVDDIFAVIDAVTVERVLVIVGFGEEVAILQVACVVHIVRVEHRAHDDEAGLMRNRVTQLRKLFEERSGEIDFPSVVHCIPPVAPPCLRAVDREGVIRVELREDAFTRQVTLPPVELAGVAFQEPPPEPTLGAGAGRGNVEVFVENLVFFEDLEALAAFGAEGHE